MKAGAYSNQQKNTGNRIYYRFTDPLAGGYPVQIEIFSRAPEGVRLWGSPTIVPIPADGDASSLSAILMDDDYYGIVRDHTRIREGLSLLSPEGDPHLDNT